MSNEEEFAAERLHILEMIEQGKVSAEDGLSLLQALTAGEDAGEDFASDEAGSADLPLEPDTPASAPAEAPERGLCSLHGQRRTVQNLAPDGWGGRCCKPRSPCGLPAGAVLPPAAAHRAAASGAGAPAGGWRPRRGPRQLA